MTEGTVQEKVAELGRVRQMWHLLEPLHAVLYFAPEAFEEAAALGYGIEERWPSYFAWRSAPAGAAGAAGGGVPTEEYVTGAFYSFSPAMVRAYVPGIWATADPEAVLAARSRAVDRTYRALLGAWIEGPEAAEAAALARSAAEAAAAVGPAASAEPAAPAEPVAPGVPLALGAANSALPWPEAPHLVLWQAATILREHRGDGHLTALREAGLDPVEALVSFAAVGAAPVAVFASRGWSEQEWTAAQERLEARGLVTEDGTATEAGRALRTEVERRTDERAAEPWRALGEPGRARLAELLGTPWLEAVGSGLLPAETTLGIGKV
ncbi:SCO6745 family protein [Streptomyces sp. NPDC001493]